MWYNKANLVLAVRYTALDTNFIAQLEQKRLDRLQKADENKRHLETLVTYTAGSNRLVEKLDETTKKQLGNSPKVTVTNQDLAKTGDIAAVATELQNIRQDLANDTRLSAFNKSLMPVIQAVITKLDELKQVTPKDTSKAFVDAANSLQAALKTLSVDVSLSNESLGKIDTLITKLETTDFAPKVTVPKPQVTITQDAPDLTGVVDAVSSIRKSIASLQTSVEPTDMTPLVDEIVRLQGEVKKVYTRPIPVPEYPTNIKVVGSNGRDILDPTQGYAPSDKDTSTSDKYYGFLAPDGYWYILKEDTTAGTYRYTAGSTNYATNWTNRTSLTYDYYSEVF